MSLAVCGRHNLGLVLALYLQHPKYCNIICVPVLSPFQGFVSLVIQLAVPALPRLLFHPCCRTESVFKSIKMLIGCAWSATPPTMPLHLSLIISRSVVMGFFSGAQFVMQIFISTGCAGWQTDGWANFCSATRCLKEIGLNDWFG